MTTLLLIWRLAVGAHHAWGIPGPVALEHAAGAVVFATEKLPADLLLAPGADATPRELGSGWANFGAPRMPVARWRPMLENAGVPVWIVSRYLRYRCSSGWRATMVFYHVPSWTNVALDYMESDWSGPPATLRVVHLLVTRQEMVQPDLSGWSLVTVDGAKAYLESVGIDLKSPTIQKQLAVLRPPKEPSSGT